MPTQWLGVPLRKLRSACLRFMWKIACWRRILIVKLTNDGVTMPWSVNVGHGVSIRVTDGGRLIVGSRCAIGACTSISVQRGIVEISEDVFIGRGCTITALERVSIGAGALIAEYVTIRDQDHRIDVAGRIADSGFECSPVQINEDVWIGAKASILLGAKIGARAVIGAHALVKSEIPAGVVAAGTPARILRVRGGK